MAPDQSIQRGWAQITPTRDGGSASVENEYWHDWTAWWGRSEHNVNLDWDRKYDCNSKTGKITRNDGNDPSGKTMNGIAYAQMKLAIVEKQHQVTFDAQLNTGAHANVTITGSGGGEVGAGGHEGAIGGKGTLGYSISWTGKVGIVHQLAKSWGIYCECVESNSSISPR